MKKIIKNIILLLGLFIFSSSQIYANDIGKFNIKKGDSKLISSFNMDFDSFYYQDKNSNGKYYLGLNKNIGDYILDFGNNYRFEYSVLQIEQKNNFQETHPINMKFKFSYTDEDGNIKYSNEIDNIDFTLREGTITSLKVYPDNRIIIAQQHLDSIPELYYFSPEKNIVYDIHNDIITKELSGKSYPLYSVDIENDNLIIKEIEYPSDTLYNPGGYEIHTFNLSTLKLLSSQSQEPINKSEILSGEYTEKNLKYNLNIFSSKSGYNLRHNSDDGNFIFYEVLNPDKVTNYIHLSSEQHGENFSRIRGQFYENKYVYITDLERDIEFNKRFYELNNKMKIAKEYLKNNSNGTKNMGIIDNFIFKLDEQTLKKINENFKWSRYNLNKKYNNKYTYLLDYIEAKVWLEIQENSSF